MTRKVQFVPGILCELPDRLSSNRLHFDECVNPRVSDSLRERGFDVSTTTQARLQSVSDQRQLDYAIEQDRALVTCDKGFFAMTIPPRGLVHVPCNSRPPRLRAISNDVLALYHPGVSPSRTPPEQQPAPAPQTLAPPLQPPSIPPQTLRFIPGRLCQAPGRLSSPRLHLDECVSPQVANPLRARGWDVSTTDEAGLQSVPDQVQLEYAITHDRALLTIDKDFLRMPIPPRGLLHIPDNHTPPHIVARNVLTLCQPDCRPSQAPQPQQQQVTHPPPAPSQPVIPHSTPPLDSACSAEQLARLVECYRRAKLLWFRLKCGFIAVCSALGTWVLLECLF